MVPCQETPVTKKYHKSSLKKPGSIELGFSVGARGVNGLIGNIFTLREKDDSREWFSNSAFCLLAWKKALKKEW